MTYSEEQLSRFDPPLTKEHVRWIEESGVPIDEVPSSFGFLSFEPPSQEIVSWAQS